MTTPQSQGIWSRNYKSCTECSKNTNPHRAKGLCVLCYYEKYRNDHKEEIQKANKKYQSKHRERYNAYKREYNKKRLNGDQ